MRIRQYSIRQMFHTLTLLSLLLTSVLSNEDCANRYTQEITERDIFIQTRTVFTCYLGHAKPGYFVQLRRANETQREIQELTGIPSIDASIAGMEIKREDIISLTGDCVYTMSCRVYAKTEECISENTLIVHRRETEQRKIIDQIGHDPTTVNVLNLPEGSNYLVNCPLCDNSQKVLWIKAGMVMENAKNCTLPLSHIGQADYADYFCGNYDPATAKHMPFMTKITVERERMKYTLANGKLEVGTYECPDAESHPWSTIAWVLEENTLQLWLQNRREITVTDVNQVPRCKVQHFDKDYSESWLTRFRRYSDNLKITIGELDELSGDLKLKCAYTGALGPVKYSWSDGDSVVDGNESDEYSVLVKSVINDGFEDQKDRNVKCVVKNAETDDVIEETSILLDISPLTGINQAVLQASPGLIKTFITGDTFEVQCPLAGEKAAQIEWSFNGSPIDEGRMKRLDDLDKSILVVRNAQETDNGIYECKQGEADVRLIRLLMRPTQMELVVFPKEPIMAVANADSKQIICILTGRDESGKHIKWSFKATASEEEKEIDPSLIQVNYQSSILSFENPTLDDSGVYTCSAFGLEKKTEMIVEKRNIAVSPTEIVQPHGTTARFICTATSESGRADNSKLKWYRTDRKAFIPDKEQVISGSSTSNHLVLIVKDIDQYFKNVTYMCTDGDKSAYANLRIKEICAAGQRRCISGDKCISDSLFCDGKKDCEDGSDEDIERCSNCEPNHNACAAHGGDLTKNCYLKSWHCDGEKDCLNNADESNCENIVNQKCRGQNFECSPGGKQIRRAYVCDNQRDCEDGADESFCVEPEIVDPIKQIMLIGIKDKDLTLQCEAFGFPSPTIVWRYNWGPLKSETVYEIKEEFLGNDCSRVRSSLILKNVKPSDAGAYNCEALGKSSTISDIIEVSVSEYQLCKEGQFNDAALYKEMCYDCLCSGVTDDCKSAIGYTTSEVDRVPDLSDNSIRVSFYDDNGNRIEQVKAPIEREENAMVVTSSEEKRIRFVEGDWGIGGSWISSFGKSIKYDLFVDAPESTLKPGHVVHLTGGNKTIYYCPTWQSIWLEAKTGGELNNLEIRLSDRDRWFNDPRCIQGESKKSTRKDIMAVLTNVNHLAFRVDNFKKQETFKISNIAIKQSAPSGTSGLKDPEIEMCNCPEGYAGLSCEKCAEGFEVDTTSDTYKCRRICSCHKCTETGACLLCEGNRTGPRCRQCKTGFYRKLDTPIEEDCVRCDDCYNESLPFLVSDCSANALSPKGYTCRCAARQNGRLISEDCDKCRMAEKKGLTPPDYCAKREPVSKCNFYGTESVEAASDECTCKDGYSGEKCDECTEGYFKTSNNICKKCFCSGKSEKCSVSENHFYHEITPASSGNYDITVNLGRRLQGVGLDVVDEGRIIEAFAEDDLERKGPRDNFVIVEPLTPDGVNFIGIKITDKNDPEGIPVYKKLYGGMMTFKLEMPWAKNQVMTHMQQSVIVEIESRKFGRAWTYAAFNPSQRQYEIVFDEAWWTGGWKTGTGNEKYMAQMGRGQLLRFLSTADTIILTVITKNNELKHARLHGMRIEMAEDSKPTDVESPKRAAIEVCECPDGSDSSNLSCEGCGNIEKKSILRLQASGPDYECDQPNKKLFEGSDCENGYYNYNFLTGEKFEKCQKGLEMDLKGRVVYVRIGEPLVLLCRTTSYQGGILKHEWSFPTNAEPDRYLSARRNIPGKVNGSLTSESVIRVESAQQIDSGVYNCKSSNIVGNLTESFQVVVGDKDYNPLGDTSIEDSLNKNNPMPSQMPDKLPSAKNVKLEVDPEDDSVLVIKGELIIPNEEDASNYKMSWLLPNGTAIKSYITQPEEGPLKSGPFVIKFKPDKFDQNQVGSYRGYLVGSDPIKNPYSIPIEIDGDYKPLLPGKYVRPDERNYVRPTELIVNFMEPGMVELVTDPSMSVVVVWKKVGPLPDEITQLTNSTDLPEGITIDKNNNLIIHAGTREQRGDYVAIIYSAPDYSGTKTEIARLKTRIRVQEMRPVKDHNLDKDETNKPFDGLTEGTLYSTDIEGFDPEYYKCFNKTFYLVDNFLQTSTDITDKIEKISANKFKLNFPMTSATYIQFVCQPIPNSLSTGDLKMNVTSPDPRIITEVLYEDKSSVFPTKLICRDVNPRYDSTLKFTTDMVSEKDLATVLVPTSKDGTNVSLANGKDFVPRMVTIDFTRVGGFDPSRHSGNYTCFAQNSEHSLSRSLEIPEKDGPIKPVQEDVEPYNLITIYSPGKKLVEDSHEVPGEYLIDLTEGETLELICNVNSIKPDGLTSFFSDLKDRTDLETSKQSVWASVKIPNVKIEEDGGYLGCKYEAGDTIERRIKLIVRRPTDKKRKVSVESVENEHENAIYALTNETIRIRCNVDGAEDKEKYEFTREWKIARPRQSLEPFESVEGIAQSFKINTETNELILINIVNVPTEFQLVCVTKAKDKKTGVTTSEKSDPKNVIIREPVFTVSVDKHILNAQVGDSANVRCVARDKWRNKTLDHLIYSWGYAVVPKDPSEEVPNFIIAPEHLQDIDDHKVPRPWNLVQWNPKEGAIHFDNLAELKEHSSYARCFATYPNNNFTSISPWFAFNVVSRKTAVNYPKLLVEPIYSEDKKDFIGIRCKDENTDVPSKVTLQRIIPGSKQTVEAMDKMSEIRFEPKFDVIRDNGDYQCVIENEFKREEKTFKVPEEILKEDTVPFDAAKLKIVVQGVEPVTNGSHKVYRIRMNEPLNISCSYLGYRPLKSGLKWSVQFDKKVAKSANLLAKTAQDFAQRNLVLKQDGRFWSRLSTQSMRRDKNQEGTFTCFYANEEGDVIEKQTIKVELYKIIVNVEGLGPSGHIEAIEGSDGVITCIARDGYMGYTLDNVTYHWDFETLENDIVHPNEIARDTEVVNEKVSYQGILAQASELKLRCRTSFKRGAYEAPDFSFNIQRTDDTPMTSNRVELRINGTDPKSGQAISSIGEKVNLKCQGFDRVTKRPVENVNYNWIISTYEDEDNLNEYQLTDLPIRKESSPIGILSMDKVKSINDDDTKPDAVVYCVGRNEELKLLYKSEPINLYILSDKKNLDEKKIIEQMAAVKKYTALFDGIPDKKMSLDEGNDVTFKARIFNVEKDADVTDEDAVVEYTFEFRKPDGTKINVEELSNGGTSSDGNSLTISKLKPAENVQVVIKAVIKPKTKDDEEEAKTIFIRSDPLELNIIKAPGGPEAVVDQQTEKPKEVVPGNAKDVETIGFNQIKIDGISDDGTEFTGDVDEAERDLKCHVMANGAPVTKEAQEATGKLFTYIFAFEDINGNTIPISEIAEKYSSNPDEGTLKLRNLKSSPKFFKGRCIVKVVDAKDASLPESQYVAPYFLVKVPKDKQFPEADYQGNAFKVEIIGVDERKILKIDNDSIPELVCKVTDSKTNSEISSYAPPTKVDFVLYDTDSNLRITPKDFAEIVLQNGPNRLQVKDIKPDAPRNMYGNCIVYHNSQVYESERFKIFISPAYYQNKYEITVDSKPNADGSAEHSCVVKKDGKILEGTNIRWLFVNSLHSEVAPNLIYHTVEESGSKLVLSKVKPVKVVANALGDNHWQVKAFCTVNIMDATYRSAPFINIKTGTKVATSEEAPPITVTVDGTKDDSIVLKKDQVITLSCKSKDSNTGDLVDDSKYQYNWILMNKDGSSVSSTTLSTDGFEISGPKGEYLTINKVKVSANEIQVKCQVKINDETVKTEDETSATSEEGKIELSGGIYESKTFKFQVTDPVNPKDTGSSSILENQVVNTNPNRIAPYEILVKPLDGEGNFEGEVNKDHEIECLVKDYKGETIDPKTKSEYQIGWMIEGANGDLVPISTISQYLVVDQDGKLILKKFAMRAIKSPGLRFRCILESRNERDLVHNGSGDWRKVLYASKWANVKATEDGQSVDTGLSKVGEYPHDPMSGGEKINLPDSANLSVAITGISPCRNLMLPEGSDVTLKASIVGDVMKDEYVFSWTLLSPDGQLLSWNHVAQSSDSEEIQLELKGFKETNNTKYYAYVTATNRASSQKTRSEYFYIGPADKDCRYTAIDPKTNEIMNTIQIKIEGLDEWGQLGLPTDSEHTLKVTVLNTTTNEPIPNAKVKFFIQNARGENVPLNVIAEVAEKTIDNELRISNMRKGIDHTGIVEARVMEGETVQVVRSNPFKIFTKPNDSKSVYFDTNILNSDKKVMFKISPLDPQRNSVEIKDEKEDITLKCQAIVRATEAALMESHEGVSYGWDWRFKATGADASSDMGVLKVIGPDVTISKGDMKSLKNITGRCFVHVEAGLIDPQAEDAKRIRNYATDAFSFNVPPTSLLMPDSEMPPTIVPSKEGRSNDTRVVLKDLDDPRGNIHIIENANRTVTCHLTKGDSVITSKENLTVIYYWIYETVRGEKVDSSMIGKGLIIDGNKLTIIGAVTPKDQASLLRLKCKTVVVTDKSGPSFPPRHYLSPYAGVILKKEDGSNAVPNSEEVDTTANRYLPMVSGLRNDGFLSAGPGDVVNLVCSCADPTTKTITANVQDAQFFWELTHETDKSITFDDIAKKLVISPNDLGSMLTLNYVQKLPEHLASAKGKCIVYVKDVRYESEAFPIDIRPVTQVDSEKEGDGSVLFEVKGLNTRNEMPMVGGEGSLVCIPKHSKTMERIENAKISWDTKVAYLNTEGKEVESIGSANAKISEKDGRITITGDDPDAKIKLKELRCKAIVDGRTHTSLFYRLSSYVTAERPVVTTRRPSLLPPMDPIARKNTTIMVSIDGLDANGDLSGEIGSTISASCVTSFEDVQINDRLRDLRLVFYNMNGEQIDETTLGDGPVHVERGKIKIEGAKPIPGTINGRCIARTMINDKLKEFKSKIFLVTIPKGSDSAEPETPSPWPANDDRVLVTINGLDNEGKLIGVPGQDLILSVHPEVKPDFLDHAEVKTLGIKFMKSDGSLASLSDIAETAEFNNGTLILKKLKPNPGDVQYYGIGTAKVDIVPSDAQGKPKTDQKRELLEFKSKPFGTLVSGDKTVEVSNDPYKSRKNYTIKVEPLGSDGNLHMNPADSVTLGVSVQDPSDMGKRPNIISEFVFIDAFGRPVSKEMIANSVETSGPNVTLNYLRPTNEKNIYSGIVRVTDIDTGSVYSSKPFKFLVRPGEGDGGSALPSSGPLPVNSAFEYELIGFPDGIITGTEGDDISLGIKITDRETKEEVPARIKWIFSGPIGEYSEAEGLPKVAESFTKDASGAILLNGIKPDTWKSVRAVVTPLSDQDGAASVSIGPFKNSLRRKDGSTVDDQAPTSEGGITYDPTMQVRLTGVSQSGLYPYNEFDSGEFGCNLINTQMGELIDQKNYKALWTVENVDETPCLSSSLSDSITFGHKLVFKNLRKSSESVRVTCTVVYEKDGKVVKYKSKPVTMKFTTNDLSNVDREKVKLNDKFDDISLPPTFEFTQENSPDFTKYRVSITDNFDQDSVDKTLSCYVNNGPVDGKYKIGWQVSSLVDESPVALNELAEMVIVDGNTLKLKKAKKTEELMKGYQFRCAIYTEQFAKYKDNGVEFLAENKKIAEATGNKKTFIKYSEPFKVAGGPQTHDQSMPSSDTLKIIVEPVKREGLIHLRPGDDIVLTCKPFNNLASELYKPSGESNFVWQVRDNEGSQELVSYDQFSKNVKMETIDGVSKLSIENAIKSANTDNDYVIRCVYELNGGQLKYRSVYYRLLVSEKTPDSHGTQDATGGYASFADDGKYKVKIAGLTDKAEPYKKSLARLVMDANQPSSLDVRAFFNETIQVPKADASYSWHFMTKDGEKVDNFCDEIETEIDNIKFKGFRSKEPVLAYAVAYIKNFDENGRADALSSQKKYKSDTFEIMSRDQYKTVIDQHPGDTEDSVKPQVFVKISDVPDNIEEGSDLSVEGSFYFINNGSRVEDAGLTGSVWIWKDVNDNFLEMDKLADSYESIGAKFVAKGMKPLKGAKGKLRMVYEDPVTGQGFEYFSALVQPNVIGKVGPDEKAQIAEDSNNLDKNPVPGTNEKIAIKFDNPDIKDDLLVVESGDKVTLTIDATNTETGEKLTRDATNPSIISHNVRAYDEYNTEIPARQIGDVKFNTADGTFEMANLKPGVYKLKAEVIMDERPMETKAEDGTGEDSAMKPLKTQRGRTPVKYFSPYLIIDSSGSETKNVLDDPQNNKYKLTVDGLDARGFISTIPDKDVGVKVKLTEGESEEATKPADSYYKWMFYDTEGNEIPTSLLGDSYHVNKETGELMIKSFSESAYKVGVTGKAVLVREIQTPSGETKKRMYESKLTRFVMPDMPAGGVDDSKTYEMPEFELEITSTSNEVYKTKKDELVVIPRNQRPFQLQCTAKYLDGRKRPARAKNGDYLPKLRWHVMRPAFNGDVYYPAEWKPVSDNPRVLTLNMLPQIENYLTMTSGSYFSNHRGDDLYKCEAKDDKNNIVQSKIIVFRKDKEPYEAFILGRNGETETRGFVNDSTTLHCKVEDSKTGNSISPISYAWEYGNNNKWLKSISANTVALSSDGMNEKSLNLNNFVLPGDIDAWMFEFRCRVQVNSTYDIYSQPYEVKIKRRPELKRIRLSLMAGDNEEFTITPDRQNDYVVKIDATKINTIYCKPEFVNKQENVEISWEKCKDPKCKESVELRPKVYTKSFFANKTTVNDEAFYRCKVHVFDRDYNLDMISYKIVEVKRMAPPRPSMRKTSMTLKTFEKMVLICADHSASPRARVTWEFEPSMPDVPLDPNPVDVRYQKIDGLKYLIIIPDEEVKTYHSGKYKCILENEFGRAEKTTEVKVEERKPDVYSVVTN